MAEELDLPDEVFGFGSWLLWLLATRATAVVDEAFAAGPARPSRHYGMVDGHPVPTPSLVAWLLTAAESGTPPDRLTHRDPRLDERQKVLRTIISRAVGGEPRLFKDGWLRDLAAVCGLGEPEVQLLARCRGEEGYPVDPPALRTAIARTLRTQPSDGSPAPGMQAGGVAAATRTLPRDIASFTGREPEVRQLAAAAAGAAGSGGVVGIYAIGGMAGVGKTTFAVHAAHQLASRFPDGQVFLPLHGHTPGHRPVDPADALASLLQVSGVAARRIPPGLEARIALWRDRVAGKRLLLLLDDAVGHEQVRPLLPGTAGSLVLVTSRRHLTALEDTQTISLDMLSAGEAAELLIRLAARPDLEPSDPAVAEIIRLCGCLPLAVGMLARQLHHHPAWTPAGLAGDLAAARDRLELMAAENVSVAAAFDLSYADLTPGQQLLFRRLGLHPGTDIDAYAAAALDGTDLAAARRRLDALYDQCLLTEPARGRWPPPTPPPRLTPPWAGSWTTTSAPPPSPRPAWPASPGPRPARPPSPHRRPRPPACRTSPGRCRGHGPNGPACSPASTTPPAPASMPGSSPSPPPWPLCCATTAPGPTPSPATPPPSRPPGTSATG